MPMHRFTELAYVAHILNTIIDQILIRPTLLSCQPRVTVTLCSLYKVIRDLYSIDHLCINPIRRILDRSHDRYSIDHSIDHLCINPIRRIGLIHK